MEPGQAPNFNSPKSKLHCAASIRSLKASGTVSESPALPLHDALPALNGACGLESATPILLSGIDRLDGFFAT